MNLFDFIFCQLTEGLFGYLLNIYFPFSFNALFSYAPGPGTGKNFVVDAFSCLPTIEYLGSLGPYILKDSDIL